GALGLTDDGLSLVGVHGCSARTLLPSQLEQALDLGFCFRKPTGESDTQGQHRRAARLFVLQTEDRCLIPRFGQALADALTGAARVVVARPRAACPHRAGLV